MISLKPRLSIPTTRILSVAATVLRKEQRRDASLTIETLNPLVKEVEYAVRGPVVARAADIENLLKVQFCYTIFYRTAKICLQSIALMDLV